MIKYADKTLKISSNVNANIKQCRVMVDKMRSVKGGLQVVVEGRNALSLVRGFSVSTSSIERCSRS
jgi:hypothetical protein